MNEEEKAVEYLKEQRVYAHKFNSRQIISIITIALNLIEKKENKIKEFDKKLWIAKLDNISICEEYDKQKITIQNQQQRILELEEIEKEHKKINGELRKEIEELNKDISNMYHEQVIRNILEDECGLSKYEIDEILN